MLAYLKQYPAAAESAVILVTCLTAWYISIRVHRFFKKGIENARFPQRILLKPSHFTHTIILLLVSVTLLFFLVFFKKIGISTSILRETLHGLFLILAVHFAFNYISNTFLSRLIIIISLSVYVLRVFDLWLPFVQLLDGMSINIGHLQVSFLGLLKVCVTFTVLWSVATLANRFFGFLLSTSTRMHHSDQLLIERTIRTANTVIVVLISLAVAGIDTAVLTVAAGSLGFAIGMGLQEIGSNLICGIALLIRKPVSQGNVILLTSPNGQRQYLGKISFMGLLYVRIKTRDDTAELIPNEKFMTQKIVNLSYKDNRFRLQIEFGNAYESDIKKAISLAESAARSVERVLASPEPKCFLKAFGDSSVNLMLRLWIKDPENGMGRLKGSVLLAIYESFDQNNIQIPFPQRDLHIKSTVALPVSGG